MLGHFLDLPSNVCVKNGLDFVRGCMRSGFVFQLSVRARTCVSVCASAGACVFMHLGGWARACVCVFVRVCVRASVCLCVRVCVLTVCGGVLCVWVCKATSR